MKRSTFLTFPTEVLQQIGPHLNTTDVANLRYTSIRLARVFLPLLVNAITLDVREKIRRVKASTNAIVDYIPIPRTLLPFIKSLDIRLDPWKEEYWAALHGALRTEILGLESLKQLKLTWPGGCFTFHDEKRFLRGLEEEKILSAAFEATQEGLESLELQHSSLFCENPLWLSSPCFLSLLTLKKLRILVDDEEAGTFISVAREILARSCSLENLSIIEDTEELVVIPIRDLLPSRSTASHLPIRSLELQGALECQQNLSITNTAAFSHLVHLSLTQCSYTHDMDAFWDCLRTSKAWPQYLMLEHPINLAVVRHLTSFHGIRDLRLNIPQEPSLSALEEAVPPILRSHAASLTRLFFSTTDGYEHGDQAWCLFNMPGISPSLFENLKELRFEGLKSWSFNRASCQKLLDWLEQFPALDNVLLVWIRDFVQKNNREPSQHSGIESQLIARTGRPKYWSIESIPNPKRFTWRIRSDTENKWSFDELPDDHERNLHWNAYNEYD